MPKKLRGWLDVPEKVCVPGLQLTFDYHAEWEPSAVCPGVMLTKVDYVRMEVAEYAEPGRAPKLALKSEDIPLEILRRIPGFIEA